MWENVFQPVPTSLRVSSPPLPLPGITQNRPSAVRPSTSDLWSPVKSPIEVSAVYWAQSLAMRMRGCHPPTPLPGYT